MKFIPPLEISSKIMTLIQEANEELILVSAYVELDNWSKMKRCLEKAVSRNVKITFFARENAKQNLNFLKQNGIKLILVKDLHAKLYINENYGIVTSQNIIEYSDKNSIDIGYVTEKASERKELVDFVHKYIGSAEPLKINLSEKCIIKNVPEKIELTDNQLEYLFQNLKYAFPESHLKKASTYIFCSDILGFADIMAGKELTIKIGKNLKRSDQRLEVIKSINFDLNEDYKIDVMTTHKSYYYLTFIPEENLKFENIIKDFIEVINKMLATPFLNDRGELRTRKH